MASVFAIEVEHEGGFYTETVGIFSTAQLAGGVRAFLIETSCYRDARVVERPLDPAVEELGAAWTRWQVVTTAVMSGSQYILGSVLSVIQREIAAHNDKFPLITHWKYEDGCNNTPPRVFMYLFALNANSAARNAQAQAGKLLFDSAWKPFHYHLSRGTDQVSFTATVGEELFVGKHQDCSNWIDKKRREHHEKKAT